MGPGGPGGGRGPDRHLIFVQWLRGHLQDRAAYGDLKRRLAANGLGTFDYNGAKAALVCDIYERIFALSAHRRDPRVRP